MTFTNTSSPTREYIKHNITNSPVRRHPARPRNLVTRTNYTSWGVTRTNYTSWGADSKHPSHRPSKVLPIITHLDPSVYKSKTLHGPRRESASTPRPSTRVGINSTALDASRHQFLGPRRESASTARPTTRVRINSSAHHTSRHLDASTSTLSQHAPRSFFSSRHGTCS